MVKYLDLAEILLFHAPAVQQIINYRSEYAKLSYFSCRFTDSLKSRQLYGLFPASYSSNVFLCFFVCSFVCFSSNPFSFRKLSTSFGKESTNRPGILTLSLCNEEIHVLVIPLDLSEANYAVNSHGG